MERIDIGFLGYGTRALDALMANERYHVRYFLAPRSRLCKDVYEAERKYKQSLRLEIIDNKAELAGRIREIKDVRCFIVNACPFILNDEILSYMDFYNIHPGDLHTNRGHQPHLWSVMLDERETKICLHKINKHIDLGDVIEDVDIRLSGKENALEVLDMAEDHIPELLDGLYKYLTGEKEVKYTVDDGIYRHTMLPSDYEILPTDSLADIDRKIRARYMHNGAFFVHEGKRLYADNILSAEGSSLEGISFDKQKITYCHNGYKITMALKKITDLNGNIIFSR